MNANQNNVGRGFYLQWVLASTIGFGVGAILGMVIAIYANLNPPVAFAISFGIVFGAVGGLAQWLILRRQIPGVGLWAPASVLGFMITIGIAASMDQSVWFLFIPVFAVTVGLVQWLNLRKQGMPVGWWLAANFLGSLLGMALSYPALTAIQAERYAGAVFVMILFGFGAAFGIGLGVTTGGALVWLLRHPKSGPGVESATQGTR